MVSEMSGWSQSGQCKVEKDNV